MSEPTNFSSGVSTAGSGVWQYAPRPDPTQVTELFDDFHTFDTAQWTVTETQASATQARVDGHGGILTLTNSAVDNDLNAIQAAREGFRFAPGRKAWFEARIATSNAIEADLVVGLLITDTTPLDVTDGVFFLKLDGATTVSFFCEKDSLQSTAANVATIANDVHVRLGFHYDGRGNFLVFVNGVHVATVTPGTRLPDDEDLTVSLSVQNGDAVARSLSVDYVMVMMER
jgi:hypothetical protein